MAMSATESQKNEGQPERGTVFLGAHEKHALRVIAAMRGVSESEVLRSTLIADVVAEYEARVNPREAVTGAADAA